jgi:hypothetical protein
MSLSYERRIIFIHIQNSVFTRRKKKGDCICFFLGQGDMFLQDFNVKKFTNIVIIVSSIWNEGFFFIKLKKLENNIIFEMETILHYFIHDCTLIFTFVVFWLKFYVWRHEMNLYIHMLFVLFVWMWEHYYQYWCVI